MTIISHGEAIDHPRCQWRAVVVSKTNDHEIVEVCCNDGVECEDCGLYYCDDHRPLHGHEA